ncbi:hypothetical protein MY11210_006042 [Beauveria gryllotalpidicola]
MRLVNRITAAGLLTLVNAEPQSEARYRFGYTPKVVDIGGQLQVIASDTRYVAAAGRNRLYFIDTRFDAETAAHIKEQTE